MATKLYVGNLPFNNSDDLRDHFAQAGTVESAQVVEVG
jgi:RNA recognition motif-containing protein